MDHAILVGQLGQRKSFALVYRCCKSDVEHINDTLQNQCRELQQPCNLSQCKGLGGLGEEAGRWHLGVEDGKQRAFLGLGVWVRFNSLPQNRSEPLVKLVMI